MHYKHMYPSFRWIIENAAEAESLREEKRRAPTFFPAPSILWVPPRGNRYACVYLGPPSSHYRFSLPAPHPKTPKLRAVEPVGDIPLLKLDGTFANHEISKEADLVEDVASAVATEKVDENTPTCGNASEATA